MHQGNEIVDQLPSPPPTRRKGYLYTLWLLVVIASVLTVLPGHVLHGVHNLLEGNLTSVPGISLILLGVAMLVVIVHHLQELCDVAFEIFNWACARGYEKCAIRTAATLATLAVHTIAVAIFVA